MKKIDAILNSIILDMEEKGIAKGHESVITGIIQGKSGSGPRYLLKGRDHIPYIKMNSNSYLALSRHPDVIKAEEEAALLFGSGPGAVRFISGTHSAHISLETKLADFHSRPSAMIFSSAYVTSMGVISPLITPETVVISDALNHNCIINAIRLSRPAEKFIYKHNDMNDLENQLKNAINKGKRVLVITDGIFSMRGDWAPLKDLTDLCKAYDDKFIEGVISIADDSHGVGAFGTAGRGTEEFEKTQADILIGTLGKAFGVNGGYVASSETLIRYLRETAPMYIYSNPITVPEAAASEKAVSIVDSEEGLGILNKLRARTKQFEQGLIHAGYETIPGPHPIVPLMVRDTERTRKLTQWLMDNGVMATGLNYPVVPKGDEEIRFQISAEHTEQDIFRVLSILRNFKG
jgi:glycine C-acetyltransferase